MKLNDIWFYICAIVMIGILIFTVIQLLGGWDRFCNPYSMDSICFNMEFRCKMECQAFDWNSYGQIESTCGCDCGEHIVSACSGFAYDKNR